MKGEVLMIFMEIVFPASLLLLLFTLSEEKMEQKKSLLPWQQRYNQCKQQSISSSTLSETEVQITYMFEV